MYDDAGRCTGQAPRSQVYAQGLWHGSAGVLLRSPDRTRVYVHRRSTTKTVFAAHHDCLAGGVIDAGETPIEAARRESFVHTHRIRLGKGRQKVGIAVFDVFGRQASVVTRGVHVGASN